MDLISAWSIPRSSFFSIWMKSPTVWVIGFRINTQFSFLDGSGTVIFGNPRWYDTVTAADGILIFDISYGHDFNEFTARKFNTFWENEIFKLPQRRRKIAYTLSNKEIVRKKRLSLPYLLKKVSSLIPRAEASFNFNAQNMFFRIRLPLMGMH